MQKITLKIVYTFLSNHFDFSLCYKYIHEAAHTDLYHPPILLWACIINDKVLGFPLVIVFWVINDAQLIMKLNRLEV